MFSQIERVSLSAKGSMPARNSQRRTPRVHQSTGRPCPTLRIISGARYSGVPQRVKVLSGTTFAKPKSESFMQPRLSNNRFYGLRSRQITELLWRYSRASTTCPQYSLACSFPRVLAARRQPKRPPPCRCSSSRQTQAESWKKWWKVTTLGWLSVRRILISLSRWSTCLDSITGFFGIRLRAQSLESCLHLTSSTCPKKPSPSGFTNSQFYILCGFNQCLLRWNQPLPSASSPAAASAGGSGTGSFEGLGSGYSGLSSGYNWVSAGQIGVKGGSKALSPYPVQKLTKPRLLAETTQPGQLRLRSTATAQLVVLPSSLPTMLNTCPSPTTLDCQSCYTPDFSEAGQIATLLLHYPFQPLHLWVFLGQLGCQRLLAILWEGRVYEVGAATSLQHVGCLMHPGFKVGQVSRLRHFELVFEVKLLGVVLLQLVQPLGSQLTGVVYSRDLRPQQVFLLPWENGVPVDSALQLPLENIPDLPGSCQLFAGYQGQFPPLLKKTAGHPVGVEVQPLAPWLLPHRQQVPVLDGRPALDHKVVLAALNSPPEPNP